MISGAGSDSVVLLDACVLAPMPLCDTLLRLAEPPAFYRPVWSEDILHEVARFMEKRGYNSSQRKRRIQFMTLFFPEAMVAAPAEVARSLGSLPDPNDRHVIAAAVQAQAEVIVTLNVRDFPEALLRTYDIDVQTPDEFLVSQFDLDPKLVLERIDEQANAIKQDVASIASRLAIHAPRFAGLITKQK